MPTSDGKIQKLREETDEGEIPYLSKSRVKTWETCPRKFYYKYIEGRRGEETDAMRQGTRIHEVFEDYYHNVIEYYKPKEGTEIPRFPPTPEDLSELLPNDVLRWADWQKFIANFIAWEIQRAEESYKNNKDFKQAIEKWLPVGIEAEEWASQDDNSPPWMGFADVIVHSSTIPEIDSDDGVVIVDFKTGKTPKKKYRERGIFLEGEYYGMIFKSLYEVDGVAGYYPKNGDFLVSDLSAKRRDDVEQIIEEINQAVNSKEGKPDKKEFPIDEQPLCAWSTDPDDRCDFYDDCESNWAKPIENEQLFRQMVKNNNSAYQIADFMECEVNQVYYWASKLNLDL